MKYSVALFGHYKHRYEIRETKQTKVVMSQGYNVYGIEQIEEKMVNKIVAKLHDPPNYKLDPDRYFLYEVNGLEKRAVPGDIIAYKPFDKAHTWTPTERTEFFIVTIDTEREVLDGWFESYWDINSYYPYNPLGFDDWVKDVEEMIKEARDIEKAKKAWLSCDRDKEYADYIKSMKKACMYPMEYVKKRRMNYNPQVLDEEYGVDVGKMLNKLIIYDPQPTVDIHMSDDKLKVRNVVESDGLNIIPPVIN